MNRSTDPVPTAIIESDNATVLALQGIPDYLPSNPAVSVGQLLQNQATWSQAVQRRKALEVELANARIIEAETSHFYHDSVVNSRLHVVTLFGPDSVAVSQIGLTRRSDRKRRARRVSKAPKLAAE
jgi:hypothetical protein